MTQPPSPPRRPRSVAGTAARAAGARRARTGGWVAGTAYAPPAPAEASGGNSWPFRDCAQLEPRWSLPDERLPLSVLDDVDAASTAARRGRE